MVDQAPWLRRIYNPLAKASICWLSGVRRVGKSTLCQRLDNALLLNCDLPHVDSLLKEPVRFLRSVASPILVLMRCTSSMRSIREACVPFDAAIRKGGIGLSPDGGPPK